MRGLMEMALDGEILSEDGEYRPLFSFDPESLGEEPLE